MKVRRNADQNGKSDARRQFAALRAERNSRQSALGHDLIGHLSEAPKHEVKDDAKETFSAVEFGSTELDFEKGTCLPTQSDEAEAVESNFCNLDIVANPPRSDVAPNDLLDSELFKLPGVGIGLVWLLHRCEIETLSDLSRTNADALIGKMGPIGQLVDVVEWIKVAKSLSAAAEDTTGGVDSAVSL